MAINSFQIYEALSTQFVQPHIATYTVYCIAIPACIRTYLKSVAECLVMFLPKDESGLHLIVYVSLKISSST